MSTGAKKAWVGVGAGLIAVLAGLMVWLTGRGDSSTGQTPAPVASDGASTGGGQKAPSAPASTPVAKGPPPQDMLRAVPCELDPLVEEYRQGQGSPAWRRYVMEQLRGVLANLPPEQLWAKVEAEREPEVLEALTSLWVRRFNLTGDRAVLERVLEKTGRESDPGRKAAMVRALRASDEPSSEVLARAESTRQAYRQWVKDPAPEVREAVVGNLTNEAARGFERIQGVAEQAVASDPKTAAGLLGASSIEAVRTPAVDSVRQLLRESEHPEVRAAAAKALGTVQVGETERTMKALTERFATEDSREVRGTILESLSRLGLSSAAPVLQKLKGMDPSMDGEIDTWLSLLASRPQTWNLLLRDKQALEHGRGQKG